MKFSINYFLLVPGILVQSCRPLSQMQPAIKNGGRAVAIASHPGNNNDLLVASEGGGLFKSTDAGIKWKQVSGNETFWFNDVKYFTPDPDIVIASANADTKISNGGGIYRSPDGGNNWLHITMPVTTCNPGTDLSAYGIAIEPGSGKIWAGTNCGLALSTDQGTTWSFIPSSANYHNDRVVAVLAPSANHLKILTDQGVKISSDAGISWTFSITGLPNAIINKDVHNQIACSPFNERHIFWAFSYWVWADDNWNPHNGLYLSTDNGSSWNPLISNNGMGRPVFVRIANSLSGNPAQYDVYFADGGCTLQRGTFTNGTTPVLTGSWNHLNVDHCDHSDIAFKTDRKSPALLSSDGGLHKTSDNGANWTFTGAGPDGYNALQITEVTGQLHNTDDKSDLYFATQDNDVLASPDQGVTWPNRECCEGFFLSILRDYYSPAETKLTGVACSGCFNFISGPLFASYTGFPDPPNNNGNPCLVKKDCYVQNTKLPGLDASVFYYSDNNGGSWNARYGFAEENRSLPKVSANGGNPVIFSAVRKPGSTPDGQELTGIKKIVDVAGLGTPIVSDVDGFGSLGTYPTMFAWYKPFGIDPFDPNHIIAPDIIEEKVKVTPDGGMTWNTDANLTQLVTGSGTLKFRWGGFTQISNIAFDPDDRGHILVGTVQAGIFNSCDNGATWKKIEGSEMVPNVSSFYFMTNNQVAVSSYGRSLWRLSLDACPLRFIPPHFEYQLEVPLIYYQGAWIPLKDIHNPDVCPRCVFLLVNKGEIVEYSASKETHKLTDVKISEGSMQAYSVKGEKIQSQISFSISLNKSNEAFSKDSSLKIMLNKNFKVKGIFMEDDLFKGLLIAREDITPSQLPQQAPPGRDIHIELLPGKDKSDFANGIRVSSTGFDMNKTIRIKIDGSYIENKDSAVFDNTGSLSIIIRLPLKQGMHTLVMEQDAPQGTIKEAASFIVPVHEKKEK